MKLRQGRVLSCSVTPTKPLIQSNSRRSVRNVAKTFVNQKKYDKNSSSPAKNTLHLVGNATSSPKTTENTNGMITQHYETSDRNIAKPLTRSSKNLRTSSRKPGKPDHSTPNCSKTGDNKTTNISLSKPTKRRSSARSRSRCKRSQTKFEVDDFGDDDEEFENPFIVKDSFVDLMSGFAESEEDSDLAQEASLIYECKACGSFFRAMAGYVLHKQRSCKILNQPDGKDQKDEWNPFLIKEMFDFYKNSDDDDSLSEEEDMNPSEEESSYFSL